MPETESYGIYRDGWHYDCMLPENDELVAFCRDRAREAGGPVLDLACGTGAISIPLAREGFDVTGIDLSPAMLGVAREKAEAQGLSATWLEGDIRGFRLDRRFDLILLTSNTICHLLELSALEACLSRVRAHLSPRGRFVLVVFVPDPGKLLRRSTERGPFAAYDDPDGRGRVVVTETYRYESDTQIKRITLHHHHADTGEEVTSQIDMRMYFPQELDALLRYNGFEIVSKWGALDARTFDADSPLQVLSCALERESR